MYLGNKIKQIIKAQGLEYTEKQRTLYTTCPSCGKSDKFSVIKENGSCICYRGSCNFGKQWFVNWIMLTANVNYEEAKTMLYGAKIEDAIGENDHLTLSLKEDPTVKEKKERVFEEMTPIPWPERYTVEIDSAGGKEGADYLVSRGIPIQLAKWYGIMYSPVTRRVIFPIAAKGICYGWQGRAIDKVDKGFRMRNNDGFRRDSMIMFEDRLMGSEHAVILEGPVNAIKFHLVGGNVSTLGKVITPVQLAKIMSYKPKKLYIGLDLDAAKEIRDLAKKVSIPVYHLPVPDACVERCKAVGKKADFGECTYDECVWSIANAKLMSDDYLPMHFEDDSEILKKLNQRND